MISTSSLSRFVAVLSLFFGMLPLLMPVESGYAQEGPSLRSADRPVRVSIDPTAQYYDTANDQELTQFSSHLNVAVPIGQRFTVQARAGYARTTSSGEGETSFGDVVGLTDASGKVRYAQPVGDGSVVFSTAVNIPVGKDRLSPSESNTTRLASRNFYDTRVSSYSQGPAVSPSVAWAFPVNDQLAVGIRAMYQHQRGFQPNQGFTSDSLYVPGDGIGVNGGFEYSLNEAASVGVDLAFRRFGTDEAGGVSRFEAGNQYSGTARYLRQSDFTRVRVIARYSRWDESKQFLEGGNSLQAQVIPSQIMLMGGYKTRLTDSIDGRVRVSGHQYFETAQADQKRFGRLYLSPAFEVAEGIVLAPHGTASYGSYLGLGGGLRIQGSF